MTGASATPVNNPILALPPPMATPLTYAPAPLAPAPVPVPAYGAGEGYGQRGGSGYWRQQLDRYATFMDKAEAKEATDCENEEKEKMLKEREDMKSRIGDRLESRIANIYGTVLTTGCKSVGTTAGLTGEQTNVEKELSKLKKENEEYRRRLDKESSNNENLVDRLLRENEKLRRKSTILQDPLESSMSLLVKEMQEQMQELRVGRDFDKELLNGLKAEV
ncbi:hypothetical protein CBR_g11125 [Chara braunii]|uniref:Uncharacterized protein n=1 Tax=Chara braunii TaxID=69332 RepID=A0A388KQ84_CHABU|nr:hypothetical protein CBR_g11125 [Chara braunii]|eukprot:GBG72192.1 hypothetical protein CBR_g11125 [Chara braunii]